MEHTHGESSEDDSRGEEVAGRVRREHAGEGGGDQGRPDASEGRPGRSREASQGHAESGRQHGEGQQRQNRGAAGSVEIEKGGVEESEPAEGRGQRRREGSHEGKAGTESGPSSGSIDVEAQLVQTKTLSVAECGLVVDALRFYGRAYSHTRDAARLAETIAKDGNTCRFCGASLLSKRPPGSPPHRCWADDEEVETCPMPGVAHG